MPDTRVTVKLDQKEIDEKLKSYTGKIVSPEEPFEEGTYWGYKVRVAQSMSQVMQCGLGERKRYDLCIADSVNSDKDPQTQAKAIDEINFEKYRGFKHALLVVGGLSGLSGIIESLEQEEHFDPSVSFNEWLKSCPEQGTRTVRTEEGILIALSQLMPFLRAVGQSREKGSVGKSILL